MDQENALTWTDALFPGTRKRPDLTLQHEDGDDTIFHMIELERTP